MSFTEFQTHNVVHIPDEQEFVPKEICSSKIDDGNDAVEADTETDSGKANLELRTFRSSLVTSLSNVIPK